MRTPSGQCGQFNRLGERASHDVFDVLGNAGSVHHLFSLDEGDSIGMSEAPDEKIDELVPDGQGFCFRQGGEDGPAANAREHGVEDSSAAQIRHGWIVAGVDPGRLADGVHQLEVRRHLDRGFEVGLLSDEDEVEATRWLGLRHSDNGPAPLGQPIDGVQIVGQVVDLPHAALMVVVCGMEVGHEGGVPDRFIGTRDLVLQISDCGFFGPEPLGGRQKAHADGVEVGDEPAQERGAGDEEAAADAVSRSSGGRRVIGQLEVGGELRAALVAQGAAHRADAPVADYPGARRVLMKGGDTRSIVAGNESGQGLVLGRPEEADEVALLLETDFLLSFGQRLGDLGMRRA